MRDWQGGVYTKSADGEILAMAAVDGRVLATYDCRTIPSLLREWAEGGLHHAGVILIDDRTFRPTDIGGLLRALERLLARTGDEDWSDSVVYLQAI